MSFFSETVAALSIIGTIRRKLQKKKGADTSNIAKRFLSLFEHHNVKPNQIPRFFDHGLTLDDISSPEKLLPKLTPEMLKAASDLFAVRLEWLEAVDEQIYPCHYFYKHPEKFQVFLESLSSNSAVWVNANFIISTDKKNRCNAFIVISETVDTPEGISYVRHHLCNDWLHNYWKARADLTACIAIACKTLGRAHGIQTAAAVSDFEEGKRFLNEVEQLPRVKKRLSWLRRKTEHWQPTDWVFDPNSYLANLTDGSFGRKSALQRWLKYEEKGLMVTYLKSDTTTRESFKSALAVLK